MKILLVRGNPRKDGYTAYVTDIVVQGMHDAGAEVHDIDLTSCKITPCIGCYRCWTTTPGRCIFRDDMDKLLERIIDSNVIVCATPLYYYTMSTSAKCFFERTLPLTKQGFSITDDGQARNSLRYPSGWEKWLIPIIVGAFKSDKDFLPALETFKLIAHGMWMHFGGAIIRPESYLIQFALAKPLTVKMVETAIRRAGQEIAETGTVSAETQEKVRTPLTIDDHHFLTYSNIYWEHATAADAADCSLSELQRRVTSDVRILMREMARSIDRNATAQLIAVMQFDFPDKGLHFCLRVNRGTCELGEECADKPDLHVTASADVWARAFMREISMKQALLSGTVKVRGNTMLFRRLERYFPPPIS